MAAETEDEMIGNYFRWLGAAERAIGLKGRDETIAARRRAAGGPEGLAGRGPRSPEEGRPLAPEEDRDDRSDPCLFQITTGRRGGLDALAEFEATNLSGDAPAAGMVAIDPTRGPVRIGPGGSRMTSRDEVRRPEPRGLARLARWFHVGRGTVRARWTDFRVNMRRTIFVNKARGARAWYRRRTTSPPTGPS